MNKDDKDLVRVVLLAMLFVLLVVVVPIVVATWFSACRCAKLYNALHHTNYTCGDFFWAGDQINKSTQTIELQK